MNKAIKFNLNNPESTRSLAIFISTLEKECVTYKVTQDHGDVEVELTGGF